MIVFPVFIEILLFKDNTLISYQYLNRLHCIDQLYNKMKADKKFVSFLDL